MTSTSYFENLQLNAPMRLDRLLKPVKSSQRSTNVIVQEMCSGRQIHLDDSFYRGVEVLRFLDKHLGTLGPRASFKERSVHIRNSRVIAERLWIHFTNHKVSLDGVEVDSLLHTLYPRSSEGFIPFVSLREIAGAHKRIVEGIHYPVLGRRLHPFFGVYYPTRTEHIELFATWLSQYKGERSHCVDVGVGSGILTFLLAKAGFQSIDAIDQNPNALWSVKEELERYPVGVQINLHHADLLNPVSSTSLIVFNPPWIPGEANSSVTEALFFDGGLFERFFEQAHQILDIDGRIVLIFSTILTLIRPDIPHPIETELQKGRFELVQKLQRKVKPKQGQRTKEKVQVWELRRL